MSFTLRARKFPVCRNEVRAAYWQTVNKYVANFMTVKFDKIGAFECLWNVSRWYSFQLEMY
jgi:hypothetical protein